MVTGRLVPTFAAVMAPLVVVGALYSTSASQAQKPNRQEIVAPESWVPFSAVVQRLEPGKATNVIGRLYRGSDGSRRLESGPPERRQAVISINNFTTSENYFYSASLGGWMVLPFPAGENVRLPPKLAVDNEKMFLHEDKIEGYDVLRAVDQAQIRLIAPALNGEPLVRQRVDGTREVLSQITLGEQSPSLFEPPPGSVVKEAPTGFPTPPRTPPHEVPEMGRQGLSAGVDGRSVARRGRARE